MNKPTEPLRRARGGCLCGAVKYEVRGKLRDVINCHCSQCLRTHGHFSAYSAAKREDVHMIEDRGLKWFNSSADARRGVSPENGYRHRFVCRGGQEVFQPLTVYFQIH